MAICTTKSSHKHAQRIIKQQNKSDKQSFSDVLSKDMIEKYLSNTGQRNRIFTPELTLNTFLSQVISADPSCQAAVLNVLAKCAADGEEISANTAAYCNARKRLPEESLSALAKDTAKELEEQVFSNWLWRDRHVKLIDGSCLSMPDTPKNQKAYPQPDTQKKALDSLLLVL